MIYTYTRKKMTIKSRFHQRQFIVGQYFIDYVHIYVLFRLLSINQTFLDLYISISDKCTYTTRYTCTFRYVHLISRYLLSTSIIKSQILSTLYVEYYSTTYVLVFMQYRDDAWGPSINHVVKFCGYFLTPSPFVDNFI